MSHQYNEFWFPECIICGDGDLLGVVCLPHICHENHGLKLINNEECIELGRDNHHGVSVCSGKIMVDRIEKLKRKLSAEIIYK